MLAKSFGIEAYFLKSSFSSFQSYFRVRFFVSPAHLDFLSHLITFLLLCLDDDVDNIDGDDDDDDDVEDDQNCVCVWGRLWRC